MNKTLLLWIILIEGFVSIATEIITIRQLIPFAGNSVIVTSFIIGACLLALSYGYKRGGQYTSDYIGILQRNFLIASGLLGIGLAYSFIILFFWYVEASLINNSLYVMIAYLLLVTIPLVYLLGQTLPITMNMFDAQQRSSIVASKVLHLSTIGSFLGAVLTTVLFMNTIGVAGTIIMNSGLLMLAAILITKNTKALTATVLPILILAPLIYVFNITATNSALLFTNAYSNYNVIDPYTNIDGKIGKALAINNSSSSFAANTSLDGFEYVEKIKHIIFDDLKMRNQNILVLGGGGFSISAAGTYDNNFTYVDIDPDLKRVVTKHYAAQVNGEFVIADARVYLRTNQKKYPLIISDTYGSKSSIPAHLVTKEYFTLIANNLENSGIVIFNMIMQPTLVDKYSRTIDNTIRAVFASCMAIPASYSDKINNVLYVCKNNPVVKNNNIYNDNLNTAALDIRR